jgi:hypothetical protein
MGCAVEASPERFRYHLRRPDADEEQLIMKTATYTLSRTLPAAVADRDVGKMWVGCGLAGGWRECWAGRKS